MARISFGGLASGLDTDSIIQQLLAVEGRPISLLGQQRVKLQNRVDAYKDLNTRLDALENAAFELTKISNIVGRKATSADSDALVATANAEATPGSYQVEVLRLATSSRRNTGTGAGEGNTLGGISDATDFSGETLSQINSNNRLREDLTEGTFSVNGQQVLITSSDTFNDILTKISTATSGAVTGSLVTDPAKGGLVIELSSASQITVSTGTSNFLALTNLNTASYSSGTLTSSDAVNAIRAELELDGSEGDTNLAQAVGSGTLTINGTSIDYNGANDSLNDIIQRINNANGNFRASLSSVGGGRVTLSSKDNGPLGISVADTGSLAAALGLTAADSQTLGQSAQIRVDNGAIQSFNKNSGITASGLDGVLLDLRDDDPGNPISITVDSTSDAAAAKVKNFVDQFNNVIKRIDELTAYNQETKQKGVLLADATVTGIRSRLFDTLFGRVKGLNGTNSTGSLYELGINTGPVGSSAGTTTQVQLDTFKLQEALEKDPLRVAQLLGAEETSTGEPGVMTRFKGYLDIMSNATGVFNERSKVLKSQIEGINDRIDSLSTRLEKRQKLLEQQFTTLEQTISRLQAQQSSLVNFFNR